MNKSLLISCLLIVNIFSLPLQAQYKYEWEMGSNALGLTQLHSPQQMTIDGEGNMYVIDSYNYRIQKYDAAGQFLLKFGSKGTADGQFISPSDIVSDAEGNVYVTDDFKDCVQKFSASGQFLSKFGNSGTADGQFQSPAGIALDVQGNIYVADTVKKCVQKFNTDGQFLLKFGSAGTADGQFMSLKDLAIDQQGNIYIPDFNSGYIKKFNTNGQVLAKFIPNIINVVTSVAVDGQGNLYISVIDDEDWVYHVRKYSASGQYIADYSSYGLAEGQHETPGGIAVDAQGNVYISDEINNNIQKFSSNGAYLWKIAPLANGQFSYPTRVAVSKEGNVYVLDSHNNRVQILSPTGKFLFKFGTKGINDDQILFPTDIDVDEAGNIYVLDRSYVKKFNPKGEFISKFGSGVGGEGYFYTAEAIAVGKNGEVHVLCDGVTHESAILKFSSTGQFLMRINIAAMENGQPLLLYYIDLDEHGNIYIAADEPVINASCVVKISSSGQLLSRFARQVNENFQGNFPDAIHIDKNGNIYLVDNKNIEEDFRIRKYSPAGQLLSTSVLPGNFSGMALDAQENLYITEESNHRVLKYSHKAEIKPYSYIQGTIYEDLNKDCIRNGNESVLAGTVVIAQPGPYYGISDSLGNYSIEVDTGTYVVEQILPEGKFFKQTCPVNAQNYTVTLKAYTDTITGNNFANQLIFEPHLTTSVSSDRRRRCFTNSTTVSYCNEGNVAATDVKVHVQLPEYVVLVSAEKPFSVGKDNHYIFNIGTLAPGICSTISIVDSVVCGQPDIWNLTQCTKVWITPGNNAPPSPDWDKSDITLKVKCIDNGFVNLSLHNTGIGHMADSSSFRIYLDASLIFQHKYKLATGDSLLLQVPANGQTLRLEADQQSYHPNKTQSSITIEACGVNSEGKVSTGYVAQLPQDDEQPEVDIECLPIIDSYDPNDKLVLPTGVTSNHYTPTNTALDYTIRFQNTGTDYAYKVVVVDTLSEYLNLSTLKIGTASHPYELSVSGKGRPILTFTFNNINLPDSTRDQLASNGFINFSIKPLASIAEKTVIENYADIFFDFNEPVRTNTVFNSIYNVPVTPINSEKVIVCLPNAVAFAGNNRVICRQDSIYMQAVSPTSGKGIWKIVKGKAQIENIHNPSSLVSELGYGENIFEWKVATTSCGNDSTVSLITIMRVLSPKVTASHSVCGQGTFSLKASGSSVNHYQWYHQADTTTVIATGAIFTTPVLTSTTTYYVSIMEEGCESEKIAVLAVVNLLPLQPVITQKETDSLFCNISGISYEWYWNENKLEVTTQQIQVSESGNYKVKVNQEGCSSPISEVFTYEKITTGLDAYASQIKVYPNPTTGSVFIELPLDWQAKLTLVDAMGRELKASMTTNQQKRELFLTGIKAGIYILQVETDKGVMIRKLIVK